MLKRKLSKEEGGHSKIRHKDIQLLIEEEGLQEIVKAALR